MLIRNATLTAVALIGMVASVANTFAEPSDVSSELLKISLDPHLRIPCKQPSDCFNHGQPACDGQQNKAVFLELCEGVCVLHLLQICPTDSSCHEGMCVGSDLNVVNVVRDRSRRACDKDQECLSSEKCLEIPGGGSECFSRKGSPITQSKRINSASQTEHATVQDNSDANGDDNWEGNAHRGLNSRTVVSADEICDTGVDHRR